MKSRVTMVIVGALFCSVVSSGCRSTDHNVAVNPVTEISFPEGEDIQPDFHLKNRNNAKDVITFARSLSAVGRYKDAALIYLDASKRFISTSGNFELDCQLAAVREYWLAGELNKANKLLDKLEQQQDIYSKAGESDDIRRLRQLLHDSESLKQIANK